jgi:hypothetical protein
MPIVAFFFYYLQFTTTLANSSGKTDWCSDKNYRESAGKKGAGFGAVVPGGNNVLANTSAIWYSLLAFVALVTPLELDFRGAASYNSRPFLLYGRGFGRQQIA